VDFSDDARHSNCAFMSTTRNTELRVVPSAGEAESNRTTLRIDSDRPVPAPPLSSEDAHARRQGTAERELDRLSQAATVEQLALGQHVNWLVASQAIFIHAFLMLFIVSGMGSSRSTTGCSAAWRWSASSARWPCTRTSIAHRGRWHYWSCSAAQSSRKWRR